MSVKMRWKVYLMSITIVLLSTFAGMLAWGISVQQSNKIIDRVYIDSVDVGGLTAEEAKEKLERYWQECVSSYSIEIYSDNFNLAVDSKEIGLSLEIDSLVNKAMGVGRRGSIGQRLYAYYLSLNSAYVIPFDIKIYEEKLKAIVDQGGATKFVIASKDAYLEQNDGKVTLFEEKNGYAVDYKLLLTDLKEKLSHAKAVQVKLPIKEEKPKLTKEELTSINTVFATYVTLLPDLASNRTNNIRIAANKINGVLVRHDEVFSFNDVVGLRNKENGYRMAATISDGSLVDDWGGGVCQVSSTLYNAALLAGMNIVERTNHGASVGYVPLGQDATVVDGKIDLKLKNIYLHPVYIVSNLRDDQLSISILGHAEDKNNNILIYNAKTFYAPQTIVKKDSGLHVGVEKVIDPGVEGFNVKVFRIYQDQAGNELSREMVSEDELAPKDRIVVIGTNGNMKK